jgi:hypothetical protein
MPTPTFTAAIAGLAKASGKASSAISTAYLMFFIMTPFFLAAVFQLFFLLKYLLI